MLAAGQRLQSSEVRSFELHHVNALWQLDFHYGSRKVLTRHGTWLTPMALVVDDNYLGRSTTTILAGDLSTGMGLRVARVALLRIEGVWRCPADASTGHRGPRTWNIESSGM